MKKLVGLLAVALFAAACSPKLPDVPVLKAVDLPIVGEEGTWKSDDYKKKPVLVVFMGSWCPWCKRTMPAIVELKKKYGDQTEIVAAFVDDTPGPVRDAIMANGFTVRSLYGAKELADQLEVNGLPQIMLFDKKHRLVKMWSGYSANLVTQASPEMAKLVK